MPDRRDVIWIDFNPQAGREMRDVHPLVVLFPRAFNERTGIVIGLAMTTSSHNETHPFAAKSAGPKGVASLILSHQPKSFEWRARKAKPRPPKKVPDDSYVRACESLEIIDIAR